MRLDTRQVPSTTAKPQPTPVIKLITPALLQSEKVAKAQQSNQNVRELFGDPKPYVIGNGDLLSILVWDHPELNIAAAGAQALSSSGAQTPAAYVVDQDGIVQFPYIGAIKLAGLTELQARNLLADKLVKSIKRPDITLRVLLFRSKKIYIDGEVKTPGNQPIDDVPMTLLEGVTRAGGFLPTSDKSHIVVTRGGVFYPINLPLLVRQGVDPSRVMLANGDVVRVSGRDENKVYVLGEVSTPKALPMNNGRMTLTEALGEAGGLNQLSSAAKQVYVIRNANEAEPVVYNLGCTGSCRKLRAQSTGCGFCRRLWPGTVQPRYQLDHSKRRGRSIVLQSGQVMQSILVLCIGNICRSPMAEGLLKYALPGKTVSSAGLSALIGKAADPLAVQLMAEQGIDISAHRAQNISTRLVNEAELILVMDLEQKKHVETQYASSRGKVFRLGEFNKMDIADPYREGIESFRAAYRLIDDGVKVFVEQITQMS